MRPPRFTIGSIAFATLILAVDFAVIRAALFDGLGLDGWAIPTLLLLPMIDALLVVAYRARRRERRNVRTAGFLVAGSLATASTLVSSCVAPQTVFDLVRAVGRPMALAAINTVTSWLGNAAMSMASVQIVLGIGVEVLLPMALFCAPSLVVALAGRWLASRRAATGGLGPAAVL
jgi:hypothetical protein